MFNKGSFVLYIPNKNYNIKILVRLVAIKWTFILTNEVQLITTRNNYVFRKYIVENAQYKVVYHFTNHNRLLLFKDKGNSKSNILLSQHKYLPLLNGTVQSFK